MNSPKSVNGISIANPILPKMCGSRKPLFFIDIEIDLYKNSDFFDKSKEEIELFSESGACYISRSLTIYIAHCTLLIIRESRKCHPNTLILSHTRHTFEKRVCQTLVIINHTTNVKSILHFSKKTRHFLRFFLHLTENTNSRLTLSPHTPQQLFGKQAVWGNVED